MNDENPENVEGEAAKVSDNPQQEGEFFRVRTPRGKEVLGIVDTRLGAGKSRVICTDKKVRVCRIPGKYRRRLWVNDSDVVIVEPWQFEGEKKGDITYKYRRVQVDWLRQKGYLKDLEVL